MATFLDTNTTSFFIEELIKKASNLLILISPCLQLNSKIKELLETKNHLKVEIYIVYKKHFLNFEEMQWIQKLDSIHLNHCKHLNAKCYLNENECIISSQNLNDLNQVHNNEMGILIQKFEDNEMFQKAYEEVQRILHKSDNIKLTQYDTVLELEHNFNITKLTTSKLAEKHKVKTYEVLEHFNKKGLLSLNPNKKYYLTALGKSHGGEFKSSQYGGYFIWPENMQF